MTKSEGIPNWSKGVLWIFEGTCVKIKEEREERGEKVVGAKLDDH
jgi:hypothetical protein